MNDENFSRYLSFPWALQSRASNSRFPLVMFVCLLCFVFVVFVLRDCAVTIVFFPAVFTPRSKVFTYLFVCYFLFVRQLLKTPVLLRTVALISLAHLCRIFGKNSGQNFLSGGIRSERRSRSRTGLHPSLGKNIEE